MNKWYIPCTCLSVTGDVPGRGVWGERSPRPRDQPSLPGSTSLKVEQIESWAGLGLCHCAAFSLTPHLQPARSSVAVGCWPHVGCTILLWPVATRQRLAKSGNGWASPLKTGLLLPLTTWFISWNISTMFSPAILNRDFIWFLILTLLQGDTDHLWSRIIFCTDFNLWKYFSAVLFCWKERAPLCVSGGGWISKTGQMLDLHSLREKKGGGGGGLVPASET